MDRYKFEDSISAYIDNELSLTDRQEFEEYIEKNPDAKSILEDILKNINLIKSLPKVKASSTFMSKLLEQVEFEKNTIEWIINWLGPGESGFSKSHCNTISR